jgi:diguanylate cyclase (GGDEF)-like protein
MDEKQLKVSMHTLTKLQVVVRISIIISLVELVIMLFLNNVGSVIGVYAEAMIDVVMLALLSSPLVYLWVIRPFVDARDEALAKVQRLALTDPLTDLANRRLLSENLEKEIARSVRHKVYGALLLIDLDKFKPINDAYGHDAGDEMLVETAKRLKSVSRSEDTVSRIGGDEFAVLVTQLDVDEGVARGKVMELAERLLHLINEPVCFKGIALHVDASIGIRLFGTEEMMMDAAIREADVAMYSIKREKGGGISLFEKQSMPPV